MNVLGVGLVVALSRPNSGSAPLIVSAPDRTLRCHTHSRGRIGAFRYLLPDFRQGLRVSDCDTLLFEEGNRLVK